VVFWDAGTEFNPMSEGTWEAETADGTVLLLSLSATPSNNLPNAFALTLAAPCTQRPCVDAGRC